MTEATRHEKLRVLFTGHAGTLKNAVARRFAEFVAQQRAATGKTVRSADAEEELRPMPTFLSLARGLQAAHWVDSVRSAVARCDRADYAFLSLHLSYRWYNRFISPFSWRRSARGASPEDVLVAELNEFRPDYCVCLIDDIQSAQQRVREGEGRIHLRLSEFLTWRNVEMLLTDMLSQQTILRRSGVSDLLQFPFERSPVVSGRQSLTMLYRYLFEPHRLRIYASYPITRTRHYSDRRKEIDDFRTALDARFCVFDPVTIDELPLQGLLSATQDQQLVLPASARWPIDIEHSLSGSELRDVVDLRRDEIEEITQLAHSKRDRNELERTVEDRDLRLVDQADCVVVYRPQYSTGLSANDADFQRATGGTTGEIQHALQIAFRPVYIVHDPKTDGDLRRGPLAPLLPTGDEYFVEVDDLALIENRAAALEALLERLTNKEPGLTSKRLVRA